MATVTTVEITGNGITAHVELTYRWYVPGNDPWVRAAGPLKSMPASGDWENRQARGSTKEVRMHSPAHGHVLTLEKFDQVKVGSKGTGFMVAPGFLIGQFSKIDWHVLSIK